METKLYSVFGALCITLLLQSSELRAQCTPTHLSIDWTFSTDISHEDDIAWDVEPIDDGDADNIKNNGFIVVGETFADNSLKRQALIIRLNPDGSLLWQTTRGGNENDVAYAVEQASNGNFIICGSTKSPKYGGKVNSNVWLFEIDLNGNYVEGSEHEYGGSGNDNGYDIKEDPSTGNYIIVGGAGNEADGDLSAHETSGINAGGEYWLLAINPVDFHVVWENIYDGTYLDPQGTNLDYARSILIDHKGNYVVSGYCTSCAPDKTEMQAMVVKTDKDGNLIWTKNYGDVSLDNVRDQGTHNIIEVNDIITHEEYYLLAGVSHPFNCFNGHNHDSYAIKIAKNGKNIWTGGCETDEGFSYGGTKKEDGLDAVQTCDGGYLIAGDVSSASGDHFVTCNHGEENTSDIWLVKINSSGEFEWDESLGDIYNDEGHSIKRLSDGSYVVAGDQGTKSNGQDLYVARFELTACSTPTGLNASTNGCHATLSWNADSCATTYILKYKKTSDANFTTVVPAANPYVVDGTPGGSNKYIWKVQSSCSANIKSSAVSGPGFKISGCKWQSGDLSEETIDLISVYPNPFSSFTTISFSLAENSSTTLELFDLSERKITTLLEANLEAGDHEVKLNREELTAGIYLLKLKVNDQTFTSKVIVE